MRDKSLVIFSGGQDSTTCLAWSINRFKTYAISFMYGQKHSVEIEQAKKICAKLNVPHQIINIDFLNELVDSALLNDGDVNAKNAQGLPASFVPNRNQLFITLAHAFAQKLGCKHLVTGVCQTDYSGYPDCREVFVQALSLATNLGAFGAEGYADLCIDIHTPLMKLSKAEIFELAEEEGVLEEVIHESHTCYNGVRTVLHEWGYGCGICSACELRENGFKEFELNKLSK